MVSITHKKVLVIADDNSASVAGEVLPSDWNDSHSVSMAVADIVAAGGLSSASAVSKYQLIGDYTGSATLATTLAGYITSNSLSQQFASLTLDAIANVSLSGSVQDGQVLTWDNTANQWKNATVGAPAVGSSTRTVGAFFNKGTLTQSGVAFFFSQTTFFGTTTFSGTAIFSTAVSVSGSLSAGSLFIAGTAKVSGTLSVGAMQIGGHVFNLSLSQSVADGQVLTYNNTDNKWRNASPAAGGSATRTAGAIYNKGTLTQSGLSVFLGPVSFGGTVSFSATVAFANMTVANLGLTGSASFAGPVAISGTLSVAYLQINGFPSGLVKLASQSFSTAQTTCLFSGSWSDYTLLTVRAMFASSFASGTLSVAIYTDGGTTPILQTTGGVTVSLSQVPLVIEAVNGTAYKSLTVNEFGINANAIMRMTLTANTGVINAIGVGINNAASGTFSGGFAILWGWRGN